MTEGVTVEQCEGCQKKVQDRWNRCPIYADPAVWWKRGGCPFNVKKVNTPQQKVRVGQQKQKQKKRG